MSEFYVWLTEDQETLSDDDQGPEKQVHKKFSLPYLPREGEYFQFMKDEGWDIIDSVWHNPFTSEQLPWIEIYVSKMIITRALESNSGWINGEPPSCDE